MAGYAQVSLQVGDRCIINVDSVNSPTGWWWGVVDNVEGGLVAHITGPFQYIDTSFVSRDPLYGDANIKPSMNYDVYPADKGTQSLVRQILNAQADRRTLERHTNIQIAELRGLIVSMGMPLDMEATVDAIRQAVAEGVRSGMTAT